MPFWKWGIAGPYIVGGTKITLDILSKVTDAVSLPGVKAAIGLASQIITIIEGVQANRDDARNLVKRLLSLLLVLANTYDGKNDNELTADVRDSVTRLTTELNVVLEGARQMQAATDPSKFKSAIKGGFLYVKNSQIIKGYTADIAWAMGVFQVEGRIQDALRLRDIQTDVRIIRRVVENIQIAGPKTQHSQLISSSVLPSQPPKLYGRDKEVNNVAGRIISTEGSHLAILGPGGIGKTALMLAVREHPVVKEKFSEYRFFVRCEQATSAALLIELIARSLRIENSSNDRMADITTRLSSITHPTLLLLDNFETPWDISSEKTRVDEILCSLSSFSLVSILITMRSNFPPSTNIAWSRPSVELDVLEKDPARDLYTNIDPKAIRDDSLDALLEELSYMPLAIKLMASRGRSGEGPSALLRLWRARASAVGEDIWRGTDKASNVEKSIRLSIESNLMKSVPKALILLSVIAMLPAGVSVRLLPKLVPSISELDLEQAKATLREATLMNTDPDALTLQLLSPIRAYVLKHHTASNDLKGVLYDGYTTFITEHGSGIGEPGFPNDVQVLSVEETNLEAILPEAIKTGPDATIYAAISFCWYQYHTRPRLDVIRNVVRVCEQKGDLSALARSKQLFGHLLRALGWYNEAQTSYADAEKVFNQLGDRVGAAQCVQSLGHVHRMQGRYNEAQVAYTDAEKVFNQFGHRLGAAECVQSLGHVHWMQNRYDKAQAAYTDAENVFNALGDRLGAAQCVQSLGEIHRMQGRYDEAQAAYTDAEKVFNELGDWLGAAQCVQWLGEVHRMQDRYDEAQAAYTDAEKVFNELSHRLGATQCVKSLGDVHRMQGRYDEAQAAYTDAEKVFNQLGDRLGAAQCVQSLGHVHRMQGRYDEGQAAYANTEKVFNELGNRLGAAQCVQSLGHVHHMQGRYDEAQEAYTDAEKVFNELGHWLGATQCVQSLGDVHRMQDRYDEAQAAYTDAEKAFNELGHRLGAAQCVDSLGEVHMAQDRYNEAQTAYTDAMKVFQQLGDRLGAAQSLESLGRVHQLQDRSVDARTSFSQAALLFKELGFDADADRCSNSAHAVT